MNFKMLKNDLRRNKMITATLFIFILLSTILVSGAVNIIFTLSGAMDTLLEGANAAHFAQLHAGTIQQSELDAFSRENSQLIKAQQTVALLGINGASIYLGDGGNSELDSVMENSFVKQNKEFDYLLDTNGNRLVLSPGQIAVPIYHMQKYGLQLGDSVRIAEGSFQAEFTIAGFARDSLMNPSMINSKRFLVSDHDWDLLQSQLGEIEYMIEFQLHDTARLHELETLYQDSTLPQKGTAMGYSLVRVINGMSDGIAAAVVILIAVLLILIAALCLRFTMLTTIEEDYREIGVMKAIGIPNGEIRKLYMVKYVAMAAIACVLGYLLSLGMGSLFTANIALYMGAAKITLWTRLVPILGAVLVFGAIVLFCRTVLGRFRRITALEALRAGVLSSPPAGMGKITLSHSPIGDVNFFLGVKELLGRFPVYGLLCFVFALCAFLMIVPLNLLNTLESPGFVSYMGAGQCDLRVDLQQTQDISARFAQTERYLQNDPEVERYTPLYTSSFKAQNPLGDYDNLKVEIGDFSVFPLAYTQGTAPQSEHDIALSAMNAEEYEKQLGDSMTLLVGTEKRELRVCGIYQDVTNGGKTAKAMLPFDPEQVIWFTINIDLKPGVSLAEKQLEFSTQFRPAKVTDVSEYVYQTLGGIIDQLRLVVILAFVLAMGIAALVTALFFKMLLAKEAGQIAIMKSLGFTGKDIAKQYLTRALLTLAAGITLGCLFASLLGEKLAGLLLSGISDLQFVIHPLSVYVLCPGALAGAVIAAMILSNRSIGNISVLMVRE